MNPSDIVFAKIDAGETPTSEELDAAAAYRWQVRLISMSDDELMAEADRCIETAESMIASADPILWQQASSVMQEAYALRDELRRRVRPN